MTTTCHNKGGVVKHQRDQSNLPDEDREGRQQKAVWSSLRRIAGERMKKIDPRIRAIFQHNRHLPMVSPFITLCVVVVYCGLTHLGVEFQVLPHLVIYLRKRCVPWRKSC